MRYLLLLTHDPETRPAGLGATAPAPPDDVVDDWAEMTRLLHEADVLLAGEGLQPPDTATTVRLRDGARLLTDGPWAETTESLVGYYLLDVPDLDAALGWAARMPNQRYGSVEVRPAMPGSDPASMLAGTRSAARTQERAGPA